MQTTNNNLDGKTTRQKIWTSDIQYRHSDGQENQKCRLTDTPTSRLEIHPHSATTKQWFTQQNRYQANNNNNNVFVVVCPVSIDKENGELQTCNIGVFISHYIFFFAGDNNTLNLSVVVTRDGKSKEIHWSIDTSPSIYRYVRCIEKYIQLLPKIFGLRSLWQFFFHNNCNTYIQNKVISDSKSLIFPLLELLIAFALCPCHHELKFKSATQVENTCSKNIRFLSKQSIRCAV